MRVSMGRIMGGNRHCMILVFLHLCAAVIGVEGNGEEEEESLLACLVHSGVMNEKMAQVLKTDCRVELLRFKRDLESHSYLPSWCGGASNGRSLHRDRDDGSDALCAHVKKILLKCTRDRNLMLPAAEDGGYMGHSLPQHFSSRVHELYETSAKKSGKKSSGKHQKNTGQSPNLLIPIAVTASVTGGLVVILCWCCLRGSAQGKCDDKPLLSLSSSGNSTASSLKSSSQRNSMKSEKHGGLSFRSKISYSGRFSLDPDPPESSKIDISQGTTAEATAKPVQDQDSLEILPPIVVLHGLPPLKPPPGRVRVPPPPKVAAPPAPSVPAPLIRPPPSVPPPPPRPPGPPPPVHGVPPPRPPPPPPVHGVHPPRPPPPPPVRGVPPPRPPSIRGVPPPRPPPPMGSRPKSTLSGAKNSLDSCAAEESDGGGSKTKLKPFFWEKVSAEPDDAMVWKQLKGGSFQFNEEMIESLFGYTAPGKTNKGPPDVSSSKSSSNQTIQIINPKKAQNLSILLKALNVTTEEVRDALEEGNELPHEFIQNLIRMAPTTDEELKLRLYNGSLSLLGPAERFLKELVEIPYSIKRLESLLFMGTLQDEASILKGSLRTLEAACTELRKSRLFLKLLEAVLKTGNRMNDGTFRGRAQAFKLDTLLKLADVKGVDGKTTLLHFVVQEVIRTEGLRAARAAREMRSLSSFKSEDLSLDSTHESEEDLRTLGLQVVSSLGTDLENVRKAAAIDADSVMGIVAKLDHNIRKAKDFLATDMSNIPEDNGFHRALRSFLQSAERDVRWMLDEEKRVTALVKSTADYFHGNAGKDEGLRLFTIVRDFLIMLDKVCKEVKNSPSKSTPKKGQPENSSPGPKPKVPNDLRQKLAPAFAEMRRNDSSSDDDDSDS